MARNIRTHILFEDADADGTSEEVEFPPVTQNVLPDLIGFVIIGADSPDLNIRLEAQIAGTWFPLADDVSVSGTTPVFVGPFAVAPDRVRARVVNHTAGAASVFLRTWTQGGTPS